MLKSLDRLEVGRLGTIRLESEHGVREARPSTACAGKGRRGGALGKYAADWQPAVCGDRLPAWAHTASWPDPPRPAPPRCHRWMSRWWSSAGRAQLPPSLPRSSSAPGCGPSWARRRGLSTLRATCLSRACRVRQCPPGRPHLAEQLGRGRAAPSVGRGSVGLPHSLRDASQHQTARGVAMAASLAFWLWPGRLPPPGRQAHPPLLAWAPTLSTMRCSRQPFCFHPRVQLFQDARGIPEQGASLMCCCAARSGGSRLGGPHHSAAATTLPVGRALRPTGTHPTPPHPTSSCLPPTQVLTYGIATAAVLRLVLIVAGVDIGGCGAGGPGQLQGLIRAGPAPSGCPLNGPLPCPLAPSCPAPCSGAV